MATPSMIPDVAVLRYPLENVQTMVFELSLIRSAVGATAFLELIARFESPAGTRRLRRRRWNLPAADQSSSETVIP